MQEWYLGVVPGVGKCVLFREVSSFVKNQE